MVPQFSESTVGCGLWQRAPNKSQREQIGGFSLPHGRNTGVGMFLTNDLKTQSSLSTIVRKKMLAC